MKLDVTKKLMEKMRADGVPDSYAVLLMKNGEKSAIFSENVNADTYFDIASMGKVLTTATLILKAIGAGKLRIMVKHILPNSISPIIVNFTMKLGVCVQFGATMSYLGMGSQPPIPEWGTMLAEGRNYMRMNPMLVVYPGIFIMLAVLAFNLMGDGVRDAMDPRLRG